MGINRISMVLCVLGFVFLPGACVTAFVAGELAREMTGSDQWAMAAMGGSILISITLVLIGEASER